MNHSSTSFYVPKDEYLYRPREVLQVMQGPYLTHKAVSNPPTFSYPTDKYEYLEPSTSDSLGSYKQLSPIKSSVPSPDLLDSSKRLVETAISNRWSQNILNAKWPEFVVAAKSLTAKQDLEDFFRDALYKPEKKRPKSAPGKRKSKEELVKIDRFERPRMPTLQRHHSYNYEALHHQPPKVLVKSKSDKQLKLPSTEHG